MSEKVTHAAVLDDCFRLTLASGEVCPAFREVMQSNWDFARLGSGTRAGDRHSVQLLTSFRDRWATRTVSDHLQAKLAFVLGWLCHRAADREMKPVFRQAEPNRTDTPSECSVYHEAYLFREVYARDPGAVYTAAIFDRSLSSLPAAQVLDVSAVRELFHTLMQQALIEIHTFDPDEEHIEDWLDGLYRLQQRFYVDIDRYARAIAEPDPAQVRRFITEVHFYDPDEPIIAVARALQRGKEIHVAHVRDAILAEAKSHYGRALGMGCRYLLAASAFFDGTMDAEVLRDRLDIGRPGWDGKSV